MRFVNYTTAGSRKVNEDSMGIFESNDKLYVCVADGVGGLNHGEFASRFVVEEFEWYCKESSSPDLLAFLNNVNARLIGVVNERFGESKAATTFTGAIVSNQSLRGAHVGDSRICILRGNGIRQLTETHTEFGRQVREGKINVSDKQFHRGKNILERAIGRTEHFDPQVFSFDLIAGDRILLSTDGFHETLSKKEIRDISVKYRSLDEFNRQIITELDNRILNDNTTFICIEI